MEEDPQREQPTNDDMRRIRLTGLTVLTGLTLCGCMAVTGTRSPQGALSLKASGFLLSTKGLTFAATDQNGFTTTLTLQEQTADTTAIQALSAGLVDLAKTGMLLAQTNTPGTNSAAK